MALHVGTRKRANTADWPSNGIDAHNHRAEPVALRRVTSNFGDVARSGPRTCVHRSGGCRAARRPSRAGPPGCRRGRQREVERVGDIDEVRGLVAPSTSIEPAKTRGWVSPITATGWPPEAGQRTNHRLPEAWLHLERRVPVEPRWMTSRISYTRRPFRGTTSRISRNEAGAHVTPRDLGW